jgi:hypothetical protein
MMVMMMMMMIIMMMKKINIWNSYVGIKLVGRLAKPNKKAQSPVCSHKYITYIASLKIPDSNQKNTLEHKRAV